MLATQASQLACSVQPRLTSAAFLRLDQFTASTFMARTAQSGWPKCSTCRYMTHHHTCICLQFHRCGPSLSATIDKRSSVATPQIAPGQQWKLRSQSTIRSNVRALPEHALQQGTWRAQRQGGHFRTPHVEATLFRRSDIAQSLQ